MKPDTVYIEGKCPSINVLKPVPVIDINVTNNCICDESLQNAFIGIKKLRKAEDYYRTQISDYNEVFTK